MPNDAVAVPSPFGDPMPRAKLIEDPRLQSSLETMLDESAFQHLGVALVDLTQGTVSPSAPVNLPYAGFRDDQQIFVGSLPKIAVMLAAYRLREQVRAAAIQLGLHEPGALFPRLVKAWKPVIDKAAQGRPSQFPKLEQIFRIDGFDDAQEIRFSDDFYDHIALMVERVGKNSAAAYCADRLGFAYINGVLQNEGLQSGRIGEKGFKGLSLSLNYGGVSWGAGDGAAVAQGATAEVVATFMTALWMHRLVSEQASVDMEGHLRLAVSWLGEGLKDRKRPPSSTMGKIGVAGTYSEGAVIERHIPGGRQMRYTAVVLGANGYPLLWRAGVDLDILMDAKISTAPGKP